MSTVDLSGARWRKSTYSGSNGGGNDNCVEIAFAGPAAAIRDSKNTAGPMLAVPAASWTAFLRECQHGKSFA
jgi:hypothetical protein